MRTMIIVGFTSLLLLTAGCGQTGPLYLPSDTAGENNEQSE